MKITIIITAILFIYAAFSTIYHDTGLIGDIGKKIGETNLSLFGHVAYINLFILFYPLYKLYSDAKVRKDIDFYLGWILLFISLVLLSALVLEPENVGFLGTQIVAFLQPLIGKAGLWLFWLMVTALATVFIIDDDFNFSGFDVKAPRLSLPSFSWIGTTGSVLKSVLKKIFTNPFSSSALEDEMMPVLEPIDEKPKRKTAVKRSTVKNTPIKKAIPKKPLSKSEKALAEELSLRSYESKESENPVIDTLKESESVTAVVEENVVHNTNVQIVSELEENSKLMNEIEKGKVAKPKNFKLPKLDFLQKAPKTTKKVNEAEIDRKIEELLAKLAQFRVDGDVVRTYSGPLVTTFEFKPAPNVKVSKILGLQDDLAMALSAETIRIQAPIPGRDVVGIEIPNESIDTIYLREILESDIFKESSSPLTVALGKDIVGNPFITDIKKLPHLLIAGTTGSGKSVGINAMILSLLYRNDPDQLKLML
ncbi:MAG TPA: DNA translocase FtsK, partial [Epsilonproteobacteria bacterium]|nr:DNA translocase FtsK [Campylobacterota bacterium]